MNSKPSLHIIKIGGRLLDNVDILAQFLDHLARIPSPVVLVHGGGKQADEMGSRLGVVSRMVEGRRVTDAATLEVVTMVYGGRLNKQLVVQLQGLGKPAVGLTGADAAVIEAKVREPIKGVDYGLVGEVTKVNTEFIQRLLDGGYTPVFAPLTYDRSGTLLNTNADTIAYALAVALCQHYETKLIFCFDLDGVREELDDPATRIPVMEEEAFIRMKEEKRIHSGMIPKLENAFQAMNQGVREVVLGPAQQLEDLVAGSTDTGTRLQKNG